MGESRWSGALARIMDLLGDAAVLKIYVNGPDQLYAEKEESFEQARSPFAGLEDLEAAIRTLAAAVGRAPSGREPVVHFRMQDGTRVAVLRPPGSRYPLLCLSK